jgi:hypothetical protein
MNVTAFTFSISVKDPLNRFAIGRTFLQSKNVLATDTRKLEEKRDGMNPWQACGRRLGIFSSDYSDLCFTLKPSFGRAGLFYLKRPLEAVFFRQHLIKGCLRPREN